MVLNFLEVRNVKNENDSEIGPGCLMIVKVNSGEYAKFEF